MRDSHSGSLNYIYGSLYDTLKFLIIKHREKHFNDAQKAIFAPLTLTTDDDETTTHSEQQTDN